MISYTYQTQFSFTINQERLLRDWIISAIEHEGLQAGMICYIFCNDEQLLEINKQYLDHDTLTDIITFPSKTNCKIISGDIFISIDRAYENAYRYNSTFQNELNRIMIHGVLHMADYDDHTKEDRSIMRSKEDYYLNLRTF